MAYTQTQLDALKAAAASGTRRVSYDGRTVEYASMAEMLHLIALIERDLARQGGSTASNAVAYPEFTKGT